MATEIASNIIEIKCTAILGHLCERFGFKIISEGIITNFIPIVFTEKA